LVGGDSEDWRFNAPKSYTPNVPKSVLFRGLGCLKKKILKIWFFFFVFNGFGILLAADFGTSGTSYWLERHIGSLQICYAKKKKKKKKLYIRWWEEALPCLFCVAKFARWVVLKFVF